VVNAMKITKTYNEYCPFIDAERTISVDYTQVKRVRNSKNGLKRGGFSCDDRNLCTYLDNDGRCTLYYLASDNA